MAHLFVDYLCICRMNLFYYFAKKQNRLPCLDSLQLRFHFCLVQSDTPCSMLGTVEGTEYARPEVTPRGHTLDGVAYLRTIPQEEYGDEDNTCPYHIAIENFNGLSKESLNHSIHIGAEGSKASCQLTTADAYKVDVAVVACKAIAHVIANAV